MDKTELHKNLKLLYIKGSDQQSKKKATRGVGENIWKPYIFIFFNNFIGV